jgi:hypothetical protein
VEEKAGRLTKERERDATVTHWTKKKKVEFPLGIGFCATHFTCDVIHGVDSFHIIYVRLS